MTAGGWGNAAQRRVVTGEVAISRSGATAIVTSVRGLLVCWLEGGHVPALCSSQLASLILNRGTPLASIN